MRTAANAILVCGLGLAFWPVATLRAQQHTAVDTSAFVRALDLESAGKYHESIPLYRASLAGDNRVSAVLGLERAYTALGKIDTLLGLLDTLIRAEPKEPIYRSSQLRGLQTLGRDSALKTAFQQWAHDVPGDPAPYKDYARLLIERNKSVAADSVIRLAEATLGSMHDMGTEIAEVRAAAGDWIAAAAAWRDALRQDPDYADAAAYSLTPTPVPLRPAVQQAFMGLPVEPASRRALASLDVAWGSSADAWGALRDLPSDTTSLEAWIDFADRAESNEQWSYARDALVSALRVRADKALTIRAARAALNAGDPDEALRLAPLADAGPDSARIARDYLPLAVRALAMVGRPGDAQQLMMAFDHWLTPSAHTTFTRAVALGWVRLGDLARARAALDASGPGADSTDTAGWLALYDGDLKSARVRLRMGNDATPDLAIALATIARVRGDSAPTLALAFLTLARRDSATAAKRFVAAAGDVPEAASILLAIAARIQAARHEDTAAVSLWKEILEREPNTPEAPDADLALARTLIRSGDPGGAIARFEHLILTYPESSLVPQARRELDIARKAIPGGSE